MRFHIGPIPESPDFSPEHPWRALREPTPRGFKFRALLLGIVASAAVGALWFFLTPLQNLPLGSPGILLGVVMAILPIHVSLHAVAHPRMGGSRRSMLGFWPSELLLYSHYDGELSRRRFIAILLMPLLIISVGPLIVCAVAGRSSALLAFGSTLNALYASGDILAVALLLFQVPADAQVRNRGWRTFWKPREKKLGGSNRRPAVLRNVQRAKGHALPSPTSVSKAVAARVRRETG